MKWLHIHKIRGLFFNESNCMDLAFAILNSNKLAAVYTNVYVSNSNLNSQELFTIYDIA